LPQGTLVRDGYCSTTSVTSEVMPAGPPSACVSSAFSNKTTAPLHTHAI
jgi:hypothetical protein